MKVSITTAARCLALTAVLAGCSGGDDDASDDRPTLTAPEGGPLSGIETYRGLSHSHVEGEVDYPVEPPVGGRHDQAWVNCGFFPEPVDPEQAVHSMEHGAVWITYRPDLPAPQVDTLRDLVADHPYLLVSPWPGELPSPVVLSAWGVQLEVASATAPGVTAFVDEFEEASQAPEPGAPCIGGVGEPAATARTPS
jgi:hypothetical protein